VIDAGETETGCTIHQVTEEVDGGPIVVQKVVSVSSSDTAESLKEKVQRLEGLAFIEAIQKLSVPTTTSYADAGVSIESGNALVERIKPFCKATRRPGCDAELGGFGGLFDLAAAGYDSSNTVLIGATDGVGTKLRIAQEMKKHQSVGIDLVAMVRDDYRNFFIIGNKSSVGLRRSMFSWKSFHFLVYPFVVLSSFNAHSLPILSVSMI
jgi:hypothetical protein